MTLRSLQMHISRLCSDRAGSQKPARAPTRPYGIYFSAKTGNAKDTHSLSPVPWERVLGRDRHERGGPARRPLQAHSRGWKEKGRAGLGQAGENHTNLDPLG